MHERKKTFLMMISIVTAALVLVSAVVVVGIFSDFSLKNALTSGEYDERVNRSEVLSRVYALPGFIRLCMIDGQLVTTPETGKLICVDSLDQELFPASAERDAYLVWPDLDPYDAAYIECPQTVAATSGASDAFHFCIRLNSEVGMFCSTENDSLSPCIDIAMTAPTPGSEPSSTANDEAPAAGSFGSYSGGARDRARVAAVRSNIHSTLAVVAICLDEGTVLTPAPLGKVCKYNEDVDEPFQIFADEIWPDIEKQGAQYVSCTTPAKDGEYNLCVRLPDGTSMNCTVTHNSTSCT